MKEKINISNDFHNTSINLVTIDGLISERQMKRAKSTLCVEGCTCSDELGQRGDQNHGYQCEPILDSHQGKVVGFEFYEEV